MDPTAYQITETFRSSSLPERKRNFQRQMEAYILTAMRRQAAVPPDRHATDPVAADGEIPYDTSE